MGGVCKDRSIRRLCWNCDKYMPLLFPMGSKPIACLQFKFYCMENLAAHVYYCDYLFIELGSNIKCLLESPY